MPSIFFCNKHDNCKCKLMNPNTICFKGRCMIYETDNEDSSEILYKSDVLYNPTYGEVFLEIDKFIHCSGDFHHKFLESIHIKQEIENGIYKIEFYLGS